MLESLIAFVREFGLVGLFITSAAGSTIFVPFSAELTFPVLLKVGVSRLWILVASVLGSYLGTIVNYVLGERSMHYALKCIKKTDLEKAHKLMDKYGWFGVLTLLAAPLPLPVDPVTILCGATKMNFKEFTAVVIVGKLIKYAIILEILSTIL